MMTAPECHPCIMYCKDEAKTKDSYGSERCKLLR